ncbi:hypothetical protein SeMB42_g07785 [Synchytrium endobioticum]|uniref:DUF4200 domain-containing protein n=1 Tax=Synchytrium endobioticum TaxID=286115 RepID=A0A507CKI8_9FUNG|nr:hypothetical protein SeMB42_g07785 [Synchytrium endobioticum]TPX38435.1 hypothetical protein SeLEV6574_g07785 [Synchytrium endobioticum]
MATPGRLPELSPTTRAARFSRRRSSFVDSRTDEFDDAPTPPPNAKSVQVTVQGTAHVAGRDDDTFVTQRAGKLMQTTNQICIPVIQTEPGAGLESRSTLQSTLLLQKKREMMDVQTQLDRKRAEFAKRMEECREKQEELRTKQRQIRDRVAKFEKFLKDNDAKRIRANSKALTERKIREQKEREIVLLKTQLQAEHIKNTGTMKLTNAYQAYEAYLQKVVDSLPPDYLEINEPHITDILARHGTLVDTASDLSKVLQRRHEEIELCQIRLAALMKERSDQVLLCNSMLGTKQKKLDGVRQQCALLEQRLEERDRTGKERMRILGEAKLAINNLYDRVSISRHGPMLPLSSVQLSTNAPAISNSPTTIPPVAPAAEKKESLLPVPGNSQAHPSLMTHNNAVTLAQKLVAVMTRLQELQEVSKRAAESMKNDGLVNAGKRGERATRMAA